MLSLSLRFSTVTVLTAALLLAGLVAPAAGEPAPDQPETVVKRLDGLPRAAGYAGASRQVTAPMPFSMVGFEVPARSSLEFRTSLDGRQWGPWTEAEVNADEGPDAASAEGRAAKPRMSEPVWVGEAAHLQTRVTGSGATARPEHAAVHLVDSLGLGRSWGRRMLDRLGAAWRGTPPAAQAMAGKPSIITRSQWGADESIRKSNGSYASKMLMGVVHHTAGSNSYTREQSAAVVRGIYSYHVRSNGWSDIGYNFLVDRYGRIYEGRYGGVTKAVIGAHAGGFNTGTFGASLMGDFSSVSPPKVMRDALLRLLAWKYDVHHVNVLGKVDYTSYGSSKYAAGRVVRMNRLSGHRDASYTACPGQTVYNLLSDMRTSVAQLQGDVFLNPKVSPRTHEVVQGRSVTGLLRFRARLRPAGPWTVAITPDGSTTPVHTATGSGKKLLHEWHPTGVTPGKYRFAITGGDRRPVKGALRFVTPTISASASPTTTTYGLDGMLRTPVTFSGKLYPGANWVVRVFDPDGARVWRKTGTAEILSTTWPGALEQPGTYRWKVNADGGPAEIGRVRVYADRVDRLAGAKSAVNAAVGISRQTWPAGEAHRAVLAPPTGPGYAFAAGSLAGDGGPVLYTGAAAVPATTQTELERALAPTATVYVLGDSSTVSDQAVADLQLRLLPRVVRRVEGSSATKVAAAAADLVFARSGATSAVVVGNSGSNAWKQGVAAGAYAASATVPVLLTNRDKLSRATAEAIARNSVTSVTIVGNGTTVSKAVRDALPSPRRVSGDKHPKTAVAVASQLLGRTRSASDDGYVFVNAHRDDGWVRALASAPYAARTGSPVLLTNAKSATTATAGFLEGLGYSRTRLGRGTVLGNTDHVGSTGRTALARLLQ